MGASLQPVDVSAACPFSVQTVSVSLVTWSDISNLGCQSVALFPAQECPSRSSIFYWLECSRLCGSLSRKERSENENISFLFLKENLPKAGQRTQKQLISQCSFSFETLYMCLFCWFLPPKEAVSHSGAHSKAQGKPSSVRLLTALEN